MILIIVQPCCRRRCVHQGRNLGANDSAGVLYHSYQIISSFPFHSKSSAVFPLLTQNCMVQNWSFSVQVHFYPYHLITHIPIMPWSVLVGHGRHGRRSIKNISSPTEPLIILLIIMINQLLLSSIWFAVLVGHCRDDQPGLCPLWHWPCPPTAWPPHARTHQHRPGDGRIPGFMLDQLSLISRISMLVLYGRPPGHINVIGSASTNCVKMSWYRAGSEVLQNYL